MTIADIYLFTLLRFIKYGPLTHVTKDTTQYKSLEQFFNTMSSHPKIAEWYDNHKPKTQKN